MASGISASCPGEAEEEEREGEQGAPRCRAGSRSRRRGGWWGVRLECKKGKEKRERVVRWMGLDSEAELLGLIAVEI